MKGNTKMTKRTGMGFSPGLVAMSIKEPIKTMKERGLVRCSGLTDHHTLETGSKEYSMEEGK